MAEEIELKLIAGPSFDEDVLVRRLQGLGKLGEPERFEQRDTYLDSESGELRAAGLSARVRERGPDRAAMVKPVPIDPGLVMRRTELSATVEPGSDPAGVLARLLRHELGVKLAGRVAPCVEIVTDRTVRMLEVPRATIEICVDRVRVLDAAQVEVGSFTEIEAELRGGEAEELQRIAAALEDSSLQASGQGKYPRARDMAGLPEYDYGDGAPDFDGDTPRREVARAVCRHQLATMRAYEPGARVGLDVEHLHKMRVASRRLRTALRVFRDELRKKDRRHLAEELAWIGSRLGDVRDLDVHGLSVATWREQLGHPQKEDTSDREGGGPPSAPEGREGGAAPSATAWGGPARPSVETEGWALLAERIAARRAQAQARLIAALDDKRWPALCERAAAAFAPRKRGAKPIWMVAPALLGRRLAKFSGGVDRFRASHSPADAHRLRILGKRLRYAAEFVRPLLSAETQEQLERLAEFQDTLGALQDTVQAGAFAKAQAGAEPMPPALADVVSRITRWADETAAGAATQVDAALDALRPDDFASAVQRELGRTPPHTEDDDGASA